MVQSNLKKNENTNSLLTYFHRTYCSTMNKPDFLCGMNKIHFFFLFSCLSLTAFTQENTTPESKSDKLSKEEKNARTHWGGLDLAVCNRGNNQNVHPYFQQNLGKSLGIRLNLFEQKWALSKNGSGFITGLTFGMDSYAWRRNITWAYNGSAANDTLIGNIDDNYTFSKNELHVWKLGVPIMFEWNIGQSEKKHFHLAAGVIGNVKLGALQTQIFENEFGKWESVNRSAFGLRTFSADATVRVGYGKMTFFASAPLQTLFNPGVTQNIYNFSAGLSILPFDPDEEIEEKASKMRQRWHI
jgi:hypothetical protein